MKKLPLTLALTVAWLASPGQAPLKVCRQMHIWYVDNSALSDAQLTHLERELSITLADSTCQGTLFISNGESPLITHDPVAMLELATHTHVMANPLPDPESDKARLRAALFETPILATDSVCFHFLLGRECILLMGRGRRFLQEELVREVTAFVVRNKPPVSVSLVIPAGTMTQSLLPEAQPDGIHFQILER